MFAPLTVKSLSRVLERFGFLWDSAVDICSSRRRQFLTEARQPLQQRRWQRTRRSCWDHGIELLPPLQSLKEAPLLGKMTIASKLLTNRRVRQGAVELLKDPSVRAMLLQQATQRFRRP